jgi:uncharacterized protein (UPF0332 family)
MISFDECLKKDLIKKSTESINWVEKEIQISKKYNNSANNVLKIKENNLAALSAYNSIMHLNRALIFSKGFVSKNHTCLISAINYLFEDKELLNLTNSFQNLLMRRNNIQYDGLDADNELAEFFVSLNNDYLEFIINFLKK